MLYYICFSPTQLGPCSAKANRTGSSQADWRRGQRTQW